MSSFNFIIILGRQPELGLVELESLLGAEHVRPFGRQAALVDSVLQIDQLGGAIKVGTVIYRGAVTALNDLPIDADALPMRQSKTPFAISAYGVHGTRSMLIAAGFELKKHLKTRGSVRLITPTEGLTVSAAGLRHNQVIETGFELMIVVAGSEMTIARTSGVQDVDWYSKRDYGRPVRSAKVGMLPPKLAQILVNTTRGDTVYDPFCGTGVILQEARLLRRQAYGSDLSTDMVDATNANMTWLTDVVEHTLPTWGVHQADAREVAVPRPGAIVSEGYLGPNLSHSPTTGEIENMRQDLLMLYRESLRNVGRQIDSGDEVSMCVPVWRVGKAWHYLGLVDELPRLGYTLRSFVHAQTPLVYARDDQVVGRQLLLLRKT
jgi:tRNA G10  N-methylase Trm11